ncbi:MAG: hypothetical protein FAZ92_01407 [Accumulibacter sp.]|uniref:hypothetical protein n=1 Tax=Accumulibacter sp. TaxID=2053492 RepID=UPI001212F706|nr:hypothetical protein [Accumulibacter sp.]QKS28678.1 MAG: hypothetical protein HT579_06925 [Candidatus Accumulibacter similis]TLD46296.1 MAG: hypothetical protein FAZ92_01407 [Accumulibacter sp.]
MKFTAEDWPKVQVSALAALLMVVVGAATLYAANRFRDAAEQARTVALAQRSEADGKLRRVREEESEIKNKSLLFNSLQERGMIGEEPRLEWIELLKDIRDRHRLLDLRYELSPQRPLDSGEVGDFAFYLSSMKLELKLLHEEDLSRFLADLRQQAKALIRINRCHVERLPAGAEERAGGRANLLAECDVDWLTARETGRKHPPDDNRSAGR